MTCVVRAVWLYISLLYFILLNLDYKESLAPFSITSEYNKSCSNPHGAWRFLATPLSLACRLSGRLLPASSFQATERHSPVPESWRLFGGSNRRQIFLHAGIHTPGTVKRILLGWSSQIWLFRLCDPILRVFFASVLKKWNILCVVTHNMY